MYPKGHLPSLNSMLQENLLFVQWWDDEGNLRFIWSRRFGLSRLSLIIKIAVIFTRDVEASHDFGLRCCESGAHANDDGGQFFSDEAMDASSSALDRSQDTTLL